MAATRRRRVNYLQEWAVNHGRQQYAANLFVRLSHIKEKVEKHTMVTMRRMRATTSISSIIRGNHANNNATAATTTPTNNNRSHDSNDDDGYDYGGDMMMTENEIQDENENDNDDDKCVHTVGSATEHDSRSPSPHRSTHLREHPPQAKGARCRLRGSRGGASLQ